MASARNQRRLRGRSRRKSSAHFVCPRPAAVPYHVTGTRRAGPNMTDAGKYYDVLTYQVTVGNHLGLLFPVECKRISKVYEPEWGRCLFLHSLGLAVNDAQPPDALSDRA